MGSDKGLLKLEAKTWAQTAFDKLTALELAIVLSVNEKQRKDYTAAFNSNELICDDRSLSIHGPLAGVLSVHLQHPAEDLLVLACDMPLMETDLLKELLHLHQQHSAKAAFVYASDGEPEPLCGIYKSGGLSHILSLYRNNQLARHSMKYMLEHIATLLVPIPDDKKKCFRNFNAHAELNGL
ncbi:MAG: molybdenum cofactor guanylyltransferase [Chitinophagaceae bacterium]|nr:molybdenum cofactor guanylyltransferase [Chitinophagaceae bacterium]